MSFRGLLDRQVTIVPITTGTADRYHNRPRTPGTPITGVPARREQTAASEDRNDRDQQRQTFTYWFAADVEIGGRDRIIDGDDTLEVIGEPNRVDGRAGVHHVEVRAEQIEG